MTPVLLVTTDQVAQFAESTGDRSPLHLSHDYARQTHVRVPVVHGALVVWRSIGSVIPASVHITSVQARFHAPAYADTEYQIVDRSEGNTHYIEVRDGRCLLVTIVVVVDSAASPSVSPGDHQWPPQIPRTQARENADLFHSDNGDAPDEVDIGTYWPHVDCSVPAIGREWVYVALAVASYVVGMEFPGRQAMLKGCRVAGGGGAIRPGNIRVRLASRRALDRGMCRLAIRLGDAGNGMDIEVMAFIRDGAAELSPVTLGSGNAGIALVTGADRGIGRAIVAALNERGWRAYSLQRRATEPWQRECDLLNGPQVHEVAAQFASSPVSLLVLNATGPLGELSVDSRHLPRVAEYLRTEALLVLNPLMAVLPLLEQAGGTCILVSTAFLKEDLDLLVPRHVGHYLAAKASAEQLVYEAQREAPSVRSSVVRLPPVRTSLAFHLRTDGVLSVAEAATLVLAEVPSSSTPGGDALMRQRTPVT